MAMKVFSSYPPAISEERLDYLSFYVKNWTIQHGLTVRPSPSLISDEINPNHVLATNAPVTLFPSPFPKKCFEQARTLQPIYNELYASIASNEAWLEAIMQELIAVDEFLAQLWKIHTSVKAEGYTHEYSLGMFRSDYMLDTSSKPTSLKQVEFNTISSSFGGLASLVTQLHTELSSFPSPEQPLAYPLHPLFSSISANGEAALTSDGHPPSNLAVSTLKHMC